MKDNDGELWSAAVNMTLRAESLPDTESIQSTFVNSGILNRILNVNDQVIYGRRGTGKTHLLKYAGPKLAASKNNGIYIYLDTRTLNSATEVAKSSGDISSRSYSLIRDICREIYNGLRTHSGSVSRYKKAGEFIQVIENSIAGVKIESNPVKVTEVTEDIEGTVKALGLSLTNLSGKAEGKKDKKRKNEIIHELSTRKTIRYPEFAKAINTYLEKLDTHLFILIDEWSSIPEELQPTVADFVKRCFLVSSKCSVKIGAIKARTKFRDNDIGFEKAADISRVDLDDYFVFDKDPEGVTTLLSEILYAHLSTVLGLNSIFTQRIQNKDVLISKLFHEKVDFVELAIASEGILRDFINIFSEAASIRLRPNDLIKITTGCVRSAARIWYKEEKSEELSEKEQSLLNLITKCTLAQNARVFIIPVKSRNVDMFQRLVDFRTLHLMQKNVEINEKDYDVYNIDYGCYIRNIQMQDVLPFRMTDKPVSEQSIQPFSGDDRWINYAKLE